MIKKCFFISLLFLHFLFSSQIDTVSVIGGGGAVGSYFTRQCFLTKEITTSIIGRKGSSHYQSISKNGLTILSSSGREVICCDVVYDCLALPPKSQKLIFVILKHPNITEEIGFGIEKIATDDALVCIISNGIPFYFSQNFFPDQKLEFAFRNLKLVHLNPLIASEIMKDGVVRMNRPIENIMVDVSGVQNVTSDDLSHLLDFFKKISVNASLKNNFRLVILEKLKFSLAISTWCVLKKRPIDSIFEDPEHQKFITYCVDTINKIGAEFNVDGLKTVEDFKKVKVTKGHFPSIYHDIYQGKTNEIDTIVAQTIRYAFAINQKRQSIAINITPLFILYSKLIDLDHSKSKL